MRVSAVVGIVGSVDSGLLRPARFLRRFDDQLGKPVAAPAVEPVGLRIFIDKAFQCLLFSSRPAEASGGGRWPSVTAAMRRLACAASPGLLTMNG
jgi:hypothetical protein